VWSWWRPGSVHSSPWPTAGEILEACDPPAEDARAVLALQFAGQVLGAIRKKKSEEQRALKTPVARAVICAPESALALLDDVDRDLRASGLIQQIERFPSEALQVDVDLALPEKGERHG
jgi:valyl-tRNA synthetase